MVIYGSHLVRGMFIDIDGKRIVLKTNKYTVATSMYGSKTFFLDEKTTEMRLAHPCRDFLRIMARTVFG